MAVQLESLIPYDKSWLIRLGVLDLLNGYDDIDKFLEQQKTLSDDLLALRKALKQWRDNEDIDAGESGTLYRFLQFASWMLNRDDKFIKHGTLKDRKINNDYSIVDLSLAELLKLDNGTSQWASAAVLFGNEEDPPNSIPYKLKLTYEAVEHWEKSRSTGKTWVARKDHTIQKQAEAYINWKKTGKMLFEPEQAEDYCFARAFELMTPKEGEKRWPSLRQHESDRIAEMEKALARQVVDSRDHRVVQAVAMLRGNSVKFSHSNVVTKSWPKFWQFIDTAHQ